MLVVAPVRERGLKLIYHPHQWHENHVAPVRERGLKFSNIIIPISKHYRRSREGAWIEIVMTMRR